MDKIKNLRKKIDELVYETETRAEGETYTEDSTRALTLVRTKLQEAKMWCGKVLEGANQPLPEEYRDYCKEREDKLN